MSNIDDIILRIQDNYRQRVQWINAKNRLVLQGKAICRSFTDGDKTKASKLYDEVKSKKNADLAAYSILLPLLAAEEPILAALKEIEKELLTEVKLLPVYKSFWSPIYGAGDMSLACIVGELGDLSKYEKKVHGIWKRAGLAVIGDERQRKCADIEKAKLHGYNPRRRSTIWNVGNCLIGKMGSGHRLFVDETIDEHEFNSKYERLFVERCLIEAEKPIGKDGKSGWRDPVTCKKTGRLKMSFSIVVTSRAKRYVEKRILRDLYRAWVGQPLDDAWMSERQHMAIAALAA